jgi:RimJ/RimL family protein N-acetyltransferase
MKLRSHDVTLVGENLTLRPMTEDDWDVLFRWNSDPDILRYTEGDDVSGYAPAQVQEIYRTVSQKAYCFMAIFDDRPIGECWLQEMNLARILQAHPDKDVRRIDLMIGEKTHRGRGLGTEMIRLLTAFAFEREHADIVFGCDIADYNIASLRAFQKAGYRLAATIEQPPGRKARSRFDLTIEPNTA